MKKIILLLLAIVFCIAGCENPEMVAEIDKYKAQESLEIKNMEVIHHFYEALDKREFDSAFNFIMADAKLYSGGFEPLSVEDMKPVIPMWYSAFPDYVHSVQEMIANDNQVYARIIYTGTHSGDFFGVPATNNNIKYLGFHSFTLENGKITEAWVLEDMLMLWEQLGMELKMKEE